MTLFDMARHEPLAGPAWNENLARAAIEAICTDTEKAFAGPRDLWPIHPLDLSDERPSPLKALYYGAAGVIWALQHLRSRGFAAPGRDYAETALALIEPMRADAERLYGAPLNSYLLGETGALLLAWTLAPSAALAAELETSIAAAVGHRSRALSWGGPGALKAALVMLERTGEPRWADLARRHVGDLLQSWRPDEAAGCRLWAHDLNGSAERRLGAFHGFAGAAAVLLQTRSLVSMDERETIEREIARTLAATAVREGAFANWKMSHDVTSGPYAEPVCLQFCMGAPGMVCALSDLPADDGTDALLLAGGELSWAAGPATKPPGLCHGAPGAGYAFLKLARRTGDQTWLDRARAFAMHATGQLERFTAAHGRRKFSVWTGDLGLALFLADCIDARAETPMVEAF